jgi:hypothetical protein
LGGNIRSISWNLSTQLWHQSTSTPMKTEIALWGLENPSRTHKVYVCVVGILLVTSFYSGWVDFIPSEWWYKAGSIVAVLMFGCIVLSFIWAHLTGKFSYFSNNDTKQRKWSTAVVGLTCFVGLCWIPVIHGFPAIATQVFGLELDSTVSLSKQKRSSRRSCGFRLVGAPLKRGLPEYLCISERTYNEIAPNVTVHINGRTTQFGYYIESFKIGR